MKTNYPLFWLLWMVYTAILVWIAVVALIHQYRWWIIVLGTSWFVSAILMAVIEDKFRYSKPKRKQKMHIV